MSADTYAGVKAVAADRKTTFLAAGKTVAPDTTIKAALGEAGMDWEVGLRPVTVDGKVVPNRKAVVRADTGHVFDVVGRGYTPIQTADALGVSDDLHTEAGFKFVALGELGEGRVTWCALEAPEGLTIAGQDAYGMTCLIETSHDGKRAVRMHIAPVRFACKNVTNLLIRNSIQRWAVPHTSKAPQRLAEAHRAVGLVKAYEEALETTAEALLGQSMTERQLTAFLTKLLPERPVKEKEVAAIRDLAVVAETNAFGRGTRYAALNAVREYYDHVRPQRTAESAFIGAMTGVNYRTTNRALDLLLPGRRPMSDVHLSKWYSAGWSPTVGRPLIGCTIRCRDCGHSEEIITARVEGDEYGKARIAAALHKCRLIDRARRGWTLSWTNWTVGFWRSKKLHLWGADLGPLEYVSRRRT